MRSALYGQPRGTRMRYRYFTFPASEVLMKERDLDGSKRMQVL